MCKTQCGDFIFLHWALDQIATSSILDHVTTYRRGSSSSHLPKLLVVSWTLVIVQATFFFFVAWGCAKILFDMSMFLLAQYVALAQLITGFLSMALCCSCQLCVSRGGGELRSLLCLSHGPELPVFSSFTYTSGSGIAESSGNTMLTFWRNCQAVFHRVYTILPSPQLCTRVPVSSPPSWCLSFSIKSFFLIVILLGVKWYLVVLICIWLMTNFCFIDYAKAFDCVDHSKLENSERDGNTRSPDPRLEKPICRSGSKS